MNKLKKQFEEAIEAFDKALKRDKNSHVAWREKGNSFYKLKKYKKTLTAVEKAINIGPKISLAWLAKGRSLGKLKNHREANVSFDEASKLKKNFSVVWRERKLPFHNENKRRRTFCQRKSHRNRS